MGSHYLIGLKAVNCETGDTLASTEAEAPNRDSSVLKQLGEASNGLREELGESMISVRRFNKPLDEATTPSLEALQAYSIGRSMQALKGDAESVPYHRQAIALDPQLRPRLCLAGHGAVQPAGDDGGGENFRKAFELRDRVSARGAVSLHRGRRIAASVVELEKANQVYKQWTQEYPAMWPRTSNRL